MQPKQTNDRPVAKYSLMKTLYTEMPIKQCKQITTCWLTACTEITQTIVTKIIC